MARIVKEYAVRRDELLDMGEQLIYSKGYERMSVQDILDALNIAKGTFYHYFDSKQALLEAVVERMIERAYQLLAPIAHNADLSAAEKFEHFFMSLAQLKTDHKALLLGLLRVWYADDNVLVRQKVSAESHGRFKPLLDAIIQQGIHENIWQTAYSVHVSDIVLTLARGLNEALSVLFLSEVPAPDHARQVHRTIDAYTDAITRVLGAVPGSLRLVDAAMIDEWNVFFMQGES